LLKKTITYENPFTKQTVSEEHYFHISKADLIEMQMENMNEPEVVHPETGQKLEGYPAMLQRIVNDKDGKEIMAIVKDMVRRSYGKKSGDRFLRGPEIWEDFLSTEAWSQLYFELCTDAEAQAEFMNGIFPSDMLEEANKLAAAQAKTNTNGHTVTTEPVEPTEPSSGRVLTNQEVVEMDSDELKSGIATGRYKLS
jgi:hypothetical protein